MHSSLQVFLFIDDIQYFQQPAKLHGQLQLIFRS